MKFDILKYWEHKVKQWNDANHCNFCYEFHAPTLDSEINKTQIENCCINVFLTNDYIEGIDYKMDVVRGEAKATYCLYGFTLYLLKPTNLGQNIYNEQKDYPIEESLRSELIQPLMNCLGCLNFECNDIENFSGNRKWRIEPVIKWLDSSYSGIKITAEILIRNES